MQRPSFSGQASEDFAEDEILEADIVLEHTEVWKFHLR